MAPPISHSESQLVVRLPYLHSRTSIQTRNSSAVLLAFLSNPGRRAVSEHCLGRRHGNSARSSPRLAPSSHCGSREVGLEERSSNRNSYASAVLEDPVRLDGDGDVVSRFAGLPSRGVAAFGDGLSVAVHRCLAIRFSTTGFEPEKFSPGPVMIIANHLSLLDTLAIRYSLPRAVRARTATVGARDFFVPRPQDHGVKRVLRTLTCAYVTHAYRVCLIGRGDDMGDGIPKITAILRSGWNVILFPEGTRSRTGRMGRFRMGFAHLAELTGAKVLPVGIQGTDEVMAVGSPLIRHGSITLRAGDPTQLRPGESHSSFLARMRAEITALSDC